MKSSAKAQKKIFSILFECLIVAVSFLIIIPLSIMFFGSFKTAGEAALFSMKPPSSWQFSNYVFVFVNGKIFRALINSFVITAGTLVFCVTTAALTAFIIARKNSRFSHFLHLFFMLGMIAPIQIITTFAVLKMVGLIGTHIGVILIMASVQLPWCIFMFSNFIKGIPRELDEASFIDGASSIQVFFMIILPILKPIMATCVVMTALYAWNEFMIPLYFFNDSQNWTMPLTVYNFFGQYYSDWNYVFADMVLTALPVTILYLYCQKYIISGLTAGAVKG